MLETTTCPECGVPAEIEWRAELAGTQSPVEHVKLRCVGRHCFLLPAASLGVSLGAEATSGGSAGCPAAGSVGDAPVAGVPRARR